jgi:hypothetical protein
MNQNTSFPLLLKEVPLRSWRLGAIKRIRVSRLLEKSQRRGARRSMSGGVLFLYVDAKSVECNEAYESFSAACLLALPGCL